MLDGKRRHVFFHGWYHGKASGEQISMLSLRKGCDIFQVRTHDWPSSSYGLLELYGKSMALNAADVSPTFYRLTENHTIDDGIEMRDIIKIVAREAPLNHLVINAHGAASSLESGRFVVHLGFDGLHDLENPNRHLGPGEKPRAPRTVRLFAALKGKVKYIWILSCACGVDLQLMSRLATLTGAWVIGHGWGLTNHSIPAGCVDWQLPASPVVWKHGHGNPTTPDLPIDRRELFLAARYDASANDFKQGLDFNLVRVVRVSGR